MRVPTSTYRLQFNQAFTLADGAAVVDYLRALGVGDVYASPLLTATSGATHGYHITDPTQVNPEVGGEEELALLAAALDDHGLGLLLDIVPNHLAANIENPWWVDVLTHGPASVHAEAFDIDWRARDGRVVLPVLGAALDDVVAEEEIRPDLDEAGLHVRYYDTRLPLDPATYPLVLDDERAPAAIAQVVRLASDLPDRADAHVDADQRRASGRDVAHGLWIAYTADDEVRRYVDDRLAELQRSPGALRRLLDAQPYELHFWRTGAARINYRRFFDITELVGVRVEDPEVFRRRHERLLELLAAGTVTGFRVDHVDGLRDPEGYLQDLRRASRSVAGDDPYLVVEKIVEGDEPLPESWPVAGTTGYELLTALNALQVDRDGLDRLEAVYRRVVGRETAVADTVHDRKLDALTDLFRGEVEGLVSRLVELADGRVDAGAIQDALVAVTACFPVYRTYVRGKELPDRDRPYLEEAFAGVRQRHPEVDPDALAFLERVLTLDADVDDDTLDVVARWQQLTGPAMAKGFEDTTFYIENRLVSVNEVGVDADSVQAPPGPADFHAGTSRRARRWPHTMNATSTHDTKRSEDVRARLNVLSEMPDEWGTAAERWLARHEPPDRNEGWMILQNLVGVWPLDPADEPGVRDRLHGFAEKAAREAKVNTSWLDVDETYESALHAFVDGSFDDELTVDELRAFADRIALPGAANSLAQRTLQLAAPGVADVYQGCELWGLSLVDPDNRRPVDFDLRRRLLAELDGHDGLLGSWRDGRIKLLVTRAGLHLRQERPELLLDGEYLPVEARGPAAGHVVAFARRHGESWAVAVAPRLPYALAGGDWPLGDTWRGTELRLPGSAPGRMTDAFTGRDVVATDVSTILEELPVALLHA